MPEEHLHHLRFLVPWGVSLGGARDVSCDKSIIRRIGIGQRLRSRQHIHIQTKVPYEAGGVSAVACKSPERARMTERVLAKRLDEPTSHVLTMQRAAAHASP